MRVAFYRLFSMYGRIMSRVLGKLHPCRRVLHTNPFLNKYSGLFMTIFPTFSSLTYMSRSLTKIYFLDIVHKPKKRTAYSQNVHLKPPLNGWRNIGHFDSMGLHSSHKDIDSTKTRRNTLRADMK